MRADASSAAAAAALAGMLLATPAATSPVAAQQAAAEVTAAQLRDLVERAASDPAALDRLRRVVRVDGRPADLERALAGAEGPEVAARLAALRRGPAQAPPRAAAAVRAEAHRILDGPRFNRSPVPRPFRGLLRRLGGWLRPVTEPLDRLWSAVTGNTGAGVVLGLFVLALSSLVTARLIRRRTSAGLSPERRPSGREHHGDPDQLDRRAAAAEAAGDLEEAVRLRFRAGVLRLHRAGAIVDRPALTTGELSRRVPLPPLPALTASFEEVAYGGRPATAADVEAARTGWPRVLAEAGRR